VRAVQLLSVTLAVALTASSALAETTFVRTGQVAGAPGSCSGLDDNFRYYTPNPQCGQPILPAPFAAADFAAACAGPQAQVIAPYVPVWTGSLACDPEARWISTGLYDTFNCYGAAVSALYCASFSTVTHCTVADSIRICWAVDDFLGDPPSFPGANPGGIYLNGADLGPAFSGVGADQQYSAVAYNVPLNAGANTLAVYQRDAGCGLGGLILSATIYTNCGTVPNESASWGSIKSIYR